MSLRDRLTVVYNKSVAAAAAAAIKTIDVAEAVAANPAVRDAAAGATLGAAIAAGVTLGTAATHKLLSWA